jgi:hypothetical protein
MKKETIKKILLKLSLLGVARKLNFSSSTYNAHHGIKEKALLEYQKRFSLNILIETGTYLGEMVSAMRNHFKKIYSIELGKELYDQAVKRFRNEKHITILNGDSGAVLVQILQEIHAPCLFWLDAHYSAGITAKGDIDTPVAQELQIILNHEIKNHVILIDDARAFTGENGYPTVETLKEVIDSKKNNYHLEILDDIIRIYPQS